jgi:hypothetical protein
MFYDRVLAAGFYYYSFIKICQGGKMYASGRQEGQALLQF